MINRNIFLGFLSIFLGISDYLLDLYIPDNDLPLVYLLLPDWAFLISLLMPLIMIISGTMLLLGNTKTKYVLVTAFTWYLILFIGATAKHSLRLFDIPFEIFIKGEILWKLIAGIILYLFLICFSVFFIGRKPQSNKSLQPTADRGG